MKNMNEDDPLLNVSRHNRGSDWTRLLHWEWEHVWCFSEQQWWEESNCYNSGGRGRWKRESGCTQDIYTWSTDAQHNSGHSSCSGKWNKDTEQKPLVSSCVANLIWYRLSSEWRYRSVRPVYTLAWWIFMPVSHVTPLHDSKAAREREHLRNLSLGCATGALNPHGSTPTHTQADIYIYSTCHTCTLQTCNHANTPSSSIKPGDFPIYI